MASSVKGFLASYYLRYIHFLGPMLVLFLIGRIFYELAPLFLGRLVDSLRNDPEELFTLSSNAGIYAAFLIGGSYILRGILFRIMDYLMIRVKADILTDIRADLFNKLKQHSLAYFYNRFSGNLGNKVLDSSQSAISITEVVAFEIIGTIITYCVALVVLYTIMPLLSFALLVWIIIFLGASIAVSFRLMRLSHIEMEARSTLSGTLVDILTNIAPVFTFGRLPEETRRYHSQLNDAKQAYWQMDKYYWYISVIQEAGFVALTSALVIGLMMNYGTGGITAGDFAIVVPQAILISQATWTLSNNIASLYSDAGNIRNTLETINAPNQIQERYDAEPLRVNEGRVKFEAVHFSYPDGALVLRDFNLQVGNGEKLALVGHSGSGKSTVMALLQRLYDVDSGAILIDGQDLRHITLESLRRNIAYVPQDITLFNRSIIENIRYGDVEADDESVYQAAQKAYAHDFIHHLPNGYQTLVGERGVKLSGGERQRIAIARAFLKNAPILLLDESTSSLDSQSEAAIQKSMAGLIENSTVIAIAHRLTTVQHFDRIVFMESGQIKASGTHEELLSNSSSYKNLWDSAN